MTMLALRLEPVHCHGTCTKGHDRAVPASVPLCDQCDRVMCSMDREAPCA